MILSTVLRILAKGLSKVRECISEVITSAKILVIGTIYVLIMIIFTDERD